MSDTKQITIASHPFTVTIPFAEGHVCSEAEAKALNQTRCENIRNNMAKVVKEAIDAEGQLVNAEEVAAKVSEYDNAYVFTLGNVGGGRATLDPVEKEARKIAREVIASALKEQGRKISDVNKDKLATAIVTKSGEEGIIKLAKKRIAERAKNTEAALDGLDL